MKDKSLTRMLDNVTLVDGEYRSEICPPPKSIKIELTGRCNYKCNYCARTMNHVRNDDMDRALYRQIIDEIAGIGIREVGLFYLGESFLVKWLPEAIEYAKKAGIEYVFLTTNGSLATSDRVQSCMDAGLDSLKFSFNYADRDQFAEVAGVKPDLFDRMVNNVKAARAVRDEGGYDCGIYLSYVGYNSDQDKKMGPIISELQPFVDEWYVLPMLVQDESMHSKNGNEWELFPGSTGRKAAQRSPIPCWSIFTKGIINSDGTMDACCYNSEMTTSIGSLKDKTFMQLWNGQTMRLLRRAHLAGDIKSLPCEICVAEERPL